MTCLGRSVRNEGAVITIGGDQLTGKSTLAENLAKRFEGRVWSTGEPLRKEAKRRGIDIAEMCRLANSDLTIDLRVDRDVCRKICEGSDDGNVLIVQGRLPAALATMAMDDLGKSPRRVHRIYLKCSIVEQTLRFLSREIGDEEHALARDALRGATLTTPREAADAVANLALPARAKNSVLRQFTSNQSRDDDDRHRFTALYGDTFDYRDPSLYDLRIDTSDIPSSETLRRAIESIEKSGCLTESDN